MRALWGLRLRPEDYRRMAAMRTLPELAVFLRAHPRWGRALEGVDLSAIHRFELEEHLRRHRLEEHLRVYPYLSREDQELLDFPVLEMELSQIMRYLRLARMGRAEEYSFTPPPRLARRSYVNFAALSAASTYDGLIQAVSGTKFAEVLRGLKPQLADREFPDFAQMETALFNVYFRELYAVTVRQRDDGMRRRLLESMGLQADLMNIAVILRVKRYYPEMEGLLLSYLLPVHHHLKPPVLQRMYAAQDASAVFEVLRGTWYGPYFPADGVSLERTLAQIRYDHSLRGLHEPLPSVVTPLSFLHLTGVELSNVIHMIECVRYNIPQEEVLSYVVGGE